MRAAGFELTFASNPGLEVVLTRLGVSARAPECDLFRKPTLSMPPETLWKPARGRPSVFSDETLRGAAGFSYARRVTTRRGAQDLVYRMFAVAAIELYQEAYPERAATLAWLLTPRRHTLLTELGRVAHPRSAGDGRLGWSERDVSRLIRTALVVAEAKPPAKDGVAMIRGLRSREGGELLG